MRVRHVDPLKAGLPGCRISSIRITTLPVGGVDDWTQVTLADENLAQVRAGASNEGDSLIARTWRCQRNAVISRDLSSRLKIGVGKHRAGSHPFTVVGILALEGGAWKLGMGEEQGLWGAAAGIFIPASTPIERSWMPFSEISRIHQVYIKVPAAMSVDDVSGMVRRLLGDPSLSMGRLKIVTPESLLVQVRRIQNTVRVAGGSVALHASSWRHDLMSLMV